MPLYIFENGKGGTREELVNSCIKSFKDDGETWERAQVQQVAMVGTPLKPDDQAASIRKGYYQAECQGGSRFKSSYSKNQIKKIWGF